MKRVTARQPACRNRGDQAGASSEQLAASLKQVSRETCLACHADAHGKPFDYEAALAAIAHPKVPPAVPVGPQYKTPLNLALRPDGQELYVTCQASSSVAVVDTATRRMIAEIPVGGQPIDVDFAADGGRAFVSNRLDDSVSVIDVATRQVIATIPVGDEPHGVLVDQPGNHLYVLNTSSDTISVIDTASLQPVKRLSAGRSPWALAMSPDGSQIYVTNMYSNFVPFRTSSVSEVTIIDTQRAVVGNRSMVNGAEPHAGGRRAPQGKFALVTLLRTKNVVPMTRVHQGWTITNGLGIVWPDGRTDQVLLDEPGLYFPDPAAIAITPDGRFALVTSSSTDRVAVVDIDKLVGLLERATPEERQRIIPNHLGKSAEFLVTHIPTLNSPRDVLILPDGKTAFVANALDDSLSVLDLTSLDGLRPDRPGRAPGDHPGPLWRAAVQQRQHHVPPAVLLPFVPSRRAHRQDHVRHGTGRDRRRSGRQQDAARDPGHGPVQVERQEPEFLAPMRCPPIVVLHPHSAVHGGRTGGPGSLRLHHTPPTQLFPAARCAADGRPEPRQGDLRADHDQAMDARFPARLRCTTCHFPPLYTDRRSHDVGTKMANDTSGLFDTPHLNNIYDSAPYLHNGVAPTLEEIWTRYNPYDTHGITNDMTKDQLNDLIEYLKTL